LCFRIAPCAIKRTIASALPHRKQPDCSMLSLDPLPWRSSSKCHPRHFFRFTLGTPIIRNFQGFLQMRLQRYKFFVRNANLFLVFFAYLQKNVYLCKVFFENDSIMKKLVLLTLCLCTGLLCLQAGTPDRRYVGGDISLLPQYEKHNSYYKDASNKKINNLLTWFVETCGWNTFRVRIFVHPDGSDLAVCQTTEYVTALGKRIKDAGAYFMLDIHYSDTWVDATHIQAPAAWKGASAEVMADSVANYTHQVLQALKAAGAAPDLVQVGNEIMYGLCGIKVAPYTRQDSNWDGYLGLLRAGCNAVRDELPEAKIIIHTDRPSNTGYNKFYYQKLLDGGVDFDIIGLSYYPFWHGYLTDEQVKAKSDKNNLVKAIKQLATDFPDKKVQIVECAYNFMNWPTSGVNYDTRDVWACSKSGQYQFVKDLVDALEPLDNVDGINYWFPEEAGNGDDSNWNAGGATVMASWLNRGFWDLNQTSNGHAINRTAAPTEANPAENVCAPYYMKNFLINVASGCEPVAGKQQTDTRKIIRNGQILVIKGDKLYDLLGREQ